jgi:mono/diheme cytochrome c family protein
MRVAVPLAVVLVLLAVAYLFFIYLGIYNVSSTVPHTRLVRWILDTTMDNSVRRRAEAIRPPILTGADRVARGSGFYRTSCEPCHGGPGAKRAAFARGLNPAPPDLVATVPDWTAAELFWIVQNGIKMSGMPAFSDCYDEGQLWDVVGFLLRLPTLTPGDYQALLEAAGPPTSRTH